VNDTPRLLLVEDSEDDAFFFRRVLRKTFPECHLEHAVDGAAAVDFLGKAASKKTSLELPHLIFLDLKMPVLSGFDVLAWIRGQEFKLSPPVIVLSGSDHTEDKKRAMELGAFDYLVKPIRAEALKTILNNLKIGSPRSSSEQPQTDKNS
jgi:DNA-binding response OmpR family regulator